MRDSVRRGARGCAANSVAHSIRCAIAAAALVRAAAPMTVDLVAAGLVTAVLVTACLVMAVLVTVVLVMVDWATDGELSGGGPPDAFDEVLLEAGVVPHFRAMAERGVEDAAFALGAGPGDAEVLVGALDALLGQVD